MSGRVNADEALISLGRLSDPAERSAAWRQGITALGVGVRLVGPPPLERVEPSQLAGATRVALASGLVDDLDWIAPETAAVALYELTSALPSGVEKHELGRRVFTRLYEGTASTFAMVAARMAYGAARSLDVPTLRARVGLLFDMPVGSSVTVDPLALALVSRRETCERWIARAGTGTMPARRLASRVLERAAREAVMRAQQGDLHPQSVLLTAPLVQHLTQLVSDREPLVWRHAAVARGLLAGTDRVTREEIELALDPSLSPTEWRRAAVSLVALASSDPKTAVQQCRSLLSGPLVKRDPGMVAVMVLGLPPVIDAEPEAAEELLGLIARSDRLDVIEATADLLADVALPSFAVLATENVRRCIQRSLPGADVATRSLLLRALRRIDRASSHSPLEAALREALSAYELRGAKEAHALAVSVLSRVPSRLDELCALDPSDEAAIPSLLDLLGDLDGAVLERSTLSHLLLLNRRPNDPDASVPLLDAVHERLGKWLLRAESTPTPQDAAQSHLARQRRLRAFLHLLDLETVRTEGDEGRERVRDRVRRAVQVLVGSLVVEPEPSSLRILSATLARGLDAVVREGIAEPSDVLLAVVHRVTDTQAISAIAEASTNPDVRRMFTAYAAFLGDSSPDSIAPRGREEEAPPSPRTREAALLARQAVRLSHALGSGGSLRGEALRRVVLKLGRALEAIAAARGLNELVEVPGAAAPSPVSELEWASRALLELIRGAVRRILDDASAGPPSSRGRHVALSVLVERAVSEGVPSNPAQMAAALRGLGRGLPEPLARTVLGVAKRIHGLPTSGGSDVFAIPLENRRTALPDWLLPRRAIGAFYVVRALGTGGVSTVFVARRLEERSDPNAELFALKVPEYNPSTARSLSEQEFMQMFREEAGALLSLPHHPNLARFVTFDLAARPKPILVMELISGVGLDRLVRTRALTAPAVFRYLDGILAGLEGMHSAGLGHLDLKPSNVILRDGEVPVLVDFGLAGRQLRPGCGTLDYCAPEVLGVSPAGYEVKPQPADIYAFGSMAFEALTASHLFDESDETALVTLHVSHDGWPDKLARLAHTGPFRDLATILAACLRRDPRHRPSAPALRRALEPVAARLANEVWPIAAPTMGVSLIG